MKLSLIAIISSLFLDTSSIYELQFTNIDGNTVSMSQFEGKKILLVNIATGSSKVSQLAGLQTLHQQYGDSLVVIGFPSNSFGHETRTNAEIKAFCQTNYGVTFLLAEKNSVSGFGVQSIFQWLSNPSLNGIMGGEIRGDFQKFLVDSEGVLIGMYSPGVAPTGGELENLVAN
jgi:glutathione peroxidase